MGTIFMNKKNGKTDKSHIFRLNRSGKLDLKNPNKNIALANLSIYYTWRNIKSAYNNNKFEILLQLGMMNFTCLIIIFCFWRSGLVWIHHSKHETITNNPPVQIYANKIKNSIAFKIKTNYKLELLSKETLKPLGRTKQVTDKDKNSENVPKLEAVEGILMHCNVVKSNCQQESKVLFTFYQMNNLDN